MNIELFEHIYKQSMYSICEHMRLASFTKYEAVREYYLNIAEGQIMTLITVAHHLENEKILSEVKALLY